MAVTIYIYSTYIHTYMDNPGMKQIYIVYIHIHIEHAYIHTKHSFIHSFIHTYIHAYIHTSTIHKPAYNPPPNTSEKRDDQ